MFRLRTLSVLAGLIATLVISAAPASGWWRSTQKPPQTQGSATVLKEGEFKVKSTVIVCPASEIKIQWHIQTKGQIKEHEKGGKQEPATEGPHLNLQIKWGNKSFSCKTKATGVENVATDVKGLGESGCELQLVQQKRVQTATGGVAKPCYITVGEGATPLCELLVPTGMETEPGSNKGINVGLTKTALSQVSENQLDKVEVTAGGTGGLAGEGTYLTQQGKHVNCPIQGASEEGELTGVEFEANNLELI